MSMDDVIAERLTGDSRRSAPSGSGVHWRPRSASPFVGWGRQCFTRGRDKSQY